MPNIIHCQEISVTGVTHVTALSDKLFKSGGFSICESNSSALQYVLFQQCPAIF